MYYIYILKSINTDHYYTGYTDNLESRLNKHNSGKSKWTNRYKPWKIIYNEKIENKIDAIKREKYLKSHSGRNWLKNKINLGP